MGVSAEASSRGLVGSTSISRPLLPVAPSASLVPGTQDAPVGAVWTFGLWGRE